MIDSLELDRFEEMVLNLDRMKERIMEVTSHQHQEKERFRRERRVGALGIIYLG